MMRLRLLSACAVSAMIMASAAPAHAQDTSDVQTAGTDPLSQAAVSPQADDGDNEEIVVTAQGRVQALSDVPLAVSAVTSEQLERTGATDIRQLNQVAPSLLVSSTGSEANASARIRGVGTVGDNPGLES